MKIQLSPLRLLLLATLVALASSCSTFADRPPAEKTRTRVVAACGMDTMDLCGSRQDVEAARR